MWRRNRDTPMRLSHRTHCRSAADNRQPGLPPNDNRIIEAPQGDVTDHLPTGKCLRRPPAQAGRHPPAPQHYLTPGDDGCAAKAASAPGTVISGALVSAGLRAATVRRSS